MTQAADVRLSEEDRRKKRAEDDKKAAELAQFRKDLNETFGSGAGRRVLRWLMDTCGYQRPSVIADPANGNPLTEGTVYNEARRNLYLSIRKYLSSEILIPVENKGLEQDEVDILS